MENKESAPIQIRFIKKKGHSGGHGGAWKVAYSDFITSMMALFIVLWILGQSKAVKDSVASYFQDPVAFNQKKGSGLLNGAGMVQPDSVKKKEMLEIQKQEMEKIATMIRSDMEQQPGLGQLINQVEIQFVKEGMRIDLSESSTSFFFDIGTATLKPDAIRILQAIAAEIGKLPNHIVIEGHTDSRRYSRIDGYTNFELSADRSNSARRILVTSGIREDQIDGVSGYADTKLKNIQDPYDASNRRISILVKYMIDTKSNG